MIYYSGPQDSFCFKNISGNRERKALAPLKYRFTIAQLSQGTWKDYNKILLCHKHRCYKSFLNFKYKKENRQLTFLQKM